MLDILKAMLFGLVEGITEWLPVSSTGHMILLEEFCKFTGVSEGFFEMFDVVIQLGAILAVVVLFWGRIFPFYLGTKAKEEGTYIRKDVFHLWGKILVACIPAAIIGIALDDWLDAHLYNAIVVSVMLVLVGFLFLVIEEWNKDRTPQITSLAEISYKTAAIIGLFQVIAAIFPGTSRSGATIIGALLIGVARPIAAEFTFDLAIPVMFGASLLKIVKFGFHFTPLEAAVLLVGMLVAFVVSMFVISFLLDYIRKHDFKVFGWYRIVLGLIVLLYFAFVA